MASKQNRKTAPKRKSKRERRLRLVIYLMIIAMVLSSLTAGLSFIL
ncbi:MAG TPA: stressosome-associated protein Prli42 [Virgibacillus sp.]|nr:stressosome-associated protein Prli42 [Virgibacillus sp.]